jgi:hypothetical protein
MGAEGESEQTRPTDRRKSRFHEQDKLLTVLAIVEDAFSYALSSNAAWAGYKNHQNPAFFPKLATGQSPSIRASLSPRLPQPPHPADRSSMPSNEMK